MDREFKGLSQAVNMVLFIISNLTTKDHIALLLRYNSGEIVLFEVTGKTGVGLCTWRVFVKNKWNNLYDK